jgi:hypothetical protein
MLSVKLSPRKLNTLIQEIQHVITRLEARRDELNSTVGSSNNNRNQVREKIVFFQNELQRLRQIAAVPPGPPGASREGAPQRGGDMIKSFTELLADIEADRSESTLRNVLSDMKESDQEPVRQYAQTLEGYFDALSPDQKEAALPGIYIELVPFLGIYARRERRRRGGGRKTRKSQRRKNLRRV